MATPRAEMFKSMRRQLFVLVLICFELGLLQGFLVHLVQECCFSLDYCTFCLGHLSFVHLLYPSDVLLFMLHVILALGFRIGLVAQRFIVERVFRIFDVIKVSTRPI